MTQLFVSIIITTYNWPQALKKVIDAFSRQTYPHFEIIVADDGSSEETYRVVESLRAMYDFEIRHVWQPDEGFQAAKIRNKAVALAKGIYLIFLDGDCLPLVSFVERHLQLAEKGWFVAGNRILLQEDITQDIFSGKIKPVLEWTLKDWLLAKRLKACNRLLPLLFLPFFPRRLRKKQWQGAKTCNLGLWREDFLQVNGLDESFKGWGYEDSDLVIRMLRHGVYRKDGRFALPVIHFWHEQQDRANQQENLQRFKNNLTAMEKVAVSGINQYLGDKQ